MHAVFPPYRAVPGPGVGIDPRVPQNVTSCFIGTTHRRENPCRNLWVSAGGQQWQDSPPISDRTHALRAASMSERRSFKVMSLRVTWMMPRSTRFRIVRDTVSRLEPIIWAMV
jgi:hypothetical protein